MNFTEYNEECGRNEFGNQFEREAMKMTALQSLLLGNELNSEELPVIHEIKCVKEFLDLPINDKRETDLKKLFALAIISAKNKGTLPFDIPYSPIAIASVIDEGLTRAKVAYKATTGELDSIEATDILIDHIAARAIAVTNKAIEKNAPIVIDKLCVAMTQIYPPSKSVVPVIKSIERHITIATKITIEKGIHTLAQAAKPLIKQVITQTKIAATRVMNFLKA